MKAGLRWQEDQRFSGDVDGVPVAVNGHGSEEPSPMQMVGVGLLGCMAIDVVEILKKGRHDVKGLDASLTAERTGESPNRFVKNRSGVMYILLKSETRRPCSRVSVSAGFRLNTFQRTVFPSRPTAARWPGLPLTRSPSAIKPPGWVGRPNPKS